MLIKRITKIKNLGLYKNFKWETELSDLKHFNVIYGWNGTGKTTLSRIFRSFELNSKHEDFKQCEFEVELYDGTKKTHNELDQLSNIRVFNSDFVEENIQWKSTESKIVFYVGKEDAELSKEIDEKTKQKKSLEKTLPEKEKLSKKNKSAFEGYVRAEASKIKSALTTPGKRDKFSSYDRRDLEEALSKFSTTNPRTFKDEEIAEKNKIIQGTPLALIQPVNIQLPDFKLIIEKMKELGETTVLSQIISSLKEDSEISNWVHHGLGLHKNKKTDVCLYCGNNIDPHRVQSLEAHFSDALDKFQSTCRQYEQTLQQRKLHFPEVNPLQFYLELREEVESKTVIIGELVKNINGFVDELIKFVAIKRDRPFEVVQLDFQELDIAEDIKAFSKSLEELNALISKHREVSVNFDTKINETKLEIEEHYISLLKGEFLELQALASSSSEAFVSDQQQITSLNAEISEKQNKLSSAGLAVEKFNELLHKFLGRKDISIELRDDKAFTFKRGELYAKNLSEGEKTAIAFIYFIIKLREHGFKVQDACIVVDDPISSLDSNSLYSAFGFMKEAVRDAKQIVILTHNFYFLKQVNEWFHRIPGKKFPKSYFMTSPRLSESGRETTIVKMDDLLKDYHSEYQYLFKKLYEYSRLENQNLETYYGVPNLARKFMETWISFKDLRPAELTNKFDKLDYDYSKKQRIISFLHANSHSGQEGLDTFDPTLLQETPNVIKDIFTMLGIIDKPHYEALLSVVTPSEAEV